MARLSKEKIFEGNSKIIYRIDEHTLIQFFKDDMRINAEKVIQVYGKGVLNNVISNYIFKRVSMVGINHHLIQKINMREQLIYALNIIPVKVCITNIASGRYVSQFGIEDGYVFDTPIIDFMVKHGANNYPIINEDQMMKFNWVDYYELKNIKTLALKLYTFLVGMFASVNIRLVECQLEFGRISNLSGDIILLADEITPDTCKLWDLQSNCKLGYERACAEPDNTIMFYKEIIKRFNLDEYSIE